MNKIKDLQRNTRSLQVDAKGVTPRGENEMAKLGEKHHHAKLTNAEVELMRSMYEGGGWSYRTLALKFDVAKATVQHIITFRIRKDG
jgi:hypothetical protein